LSLTCWNECNWKVGGMVVPKPDVHNSECISIITDWWDGVIVYINPGRGRGGRDRMVVGFKTNWNNQCISPLTLCVRFQLMEMCILQSKYILWCLVSIKLRKFHIVLLIILINTEISYYESIMAMIYTVRKLWLWCLAPQIDINTLNSIHYVQACSVINDYTAISEFSAWEVT
jgi:hypothetical protein